MKFREVRNLVVSGLGRYMELPVVLSSQIQPEMECPFVIYSSTAPYIPDSGLGEFRQMSDQQGGIIEERREEPLCTLSFTVCSKDRDMEERFILGDDEALELAEKAQGWFLHTGYDYISQSGITVVEVSNVQERSFLQVDEEARRYGFDVMIRYVRTDIRKIHTVDYAAAVEEGGRE